MAYGCHYLLQGRVLQRHGGLELGIGNALRAALVSVAGGLLFCASPAGGGCITLPVVASTALISSGAAAYSLGGSPKQAPRMMAKSE